MFTKWQSNLLLQRFKPTIKHFPLTFYIARGYTTACLFYFVLILRPTTLLSNLCLEFVRILAKRRSFLSLQTSPSSSAVTNPGLRGIVWFVFPFGTMNEISQTGSIFCGQSVVTFCCENEAESFCDNLGHPHTLPWSGPGRSLSTEKPLGQVMRALCLGTEQAME